MLTFVVVYASILKKGAKKMYNNIKDFIGKEFDEVVTASALTQARNNFKHEVFIELDKEGIVANVYDNENKDLKYWRKKYLLFAVDGSTIILPNHKSLSEEFDRSEKESKKYYQGRASIMYDVLNNIIVDSKLVSIKKGERKLLTEHIKEANEIKEVKEKRRIIIADRGYNGYDVFKELIELKESFVFRMPIDSNIVTDFVESKEEDKVVELKKTDKDDGIKVRMIKIKLKTGIEVIFTNLFDKSIKISDFKELYKLRWGVETRYSIIKDRLDLERFSGKKLEIIKQDFYSTIFISNLETVMITDINEELEKKSKDKNKKYVYKVAKSGTFNTIKDEVWNLLVNQEIEIDDILERMKRIFLKDTVPIRENRSFERKKSINNSLSYEKRKRKIVF